MCINFSGRIKKKRKKSTTLVASRVENWVTGWQDNGYSSLYNTLSFEPQEYITYSKFHTDISLFIKYFFTDRLLHCFSAVCVYTCVFVGAFVSVYIYTYLGQQKVSDIQNCGC